MLLTGQNFFGIMMKAMIQEGFKTLHDTLFLKFKKLT